MLIVLSGNQTGKGYLIGPFVLNDSLRFMCNHLEFIHNERLYVNHKVKSNMCSSLLTTYYKIIYIGRFGT